MFYSLVQTIVCVLLIQAGIYALHLNGPSANSNGASLGSGGGGGAGLGVNAPTSHGGSGAAQLNAAVNTNQMLNILSANQHAQHLHAGGSGSGSGGGGGGGVGIGLSRTLSNAAVNPLGNAGRLTQELADRAQLERERLMLLGLAKQTALANGGTGHHGRPIITGRIQMSPVDDVESDYSSLLLPQTRGPLYGSVVKEPAAVEDDEYVDEEQREYDRARLASGAHRKYEYGRIVEPAEREEYAEPQPIDELDELIEAEPEMDDVLSDLESYQYLDELLPPEHRSLWGDDGLGYGIAGGNSRPHHLNDGFPLLLNPYRTLEELENSPSHTLQEIFEKESHDKAETKAHRQHASHPTHEQQKQQQQQYEQQQQQTRHQQPTQPQQQYTFSGGYGVDYNNNMQQKWQRKRSQQQQQQRQLQQWQRNIFGQQLKQQQLHHFGTQPQRHSKLSLANSEATATKHIPLNGSTNDLNNNNNSNNKLSSALNALATQQQSSSAPIITSGVAAIKSDQLQQQQQQQQQVDEPTQQQVGKISTADDASPATGLSKAAAKLKAQQQQQQQHKKQQTPSQKQDSFLHPNHKRSGSVGGVGAANGMSAAAAAAATNGYSSIASQLMLRTARGQRQYDVPQIECPTAMDGMERFACPTPDVQGRYRCIDDHVLCDGFIDCPEGEDEDRRSCMFYKTVKAHLDVLADALLRWARGR